MKRIELKGVVKHFYYFKKDFKIFQWLYNKKGFTKEFRVLNGLNFEINDGEIVGILGANGAGKSTTLKMIAGIYTPTAGEITVNGKVTSLLELGAGFNPILTGRENIYFKGNIIGLSKIEIDNIIDDIVEFADIGEYMDMPMSSYSSGMSARVGFALAVMVDPEILIIDEVFAVGDKDFQQKSKAKTMEFFDQGKTILFVSHSEDLIRTFCNRVIYLKDGFVHYDGEVEKGIQIYHEQIRKSSKQYGLVYDKMRNTGEVLEIYLYVGKIYNGKVFESIDFDTTDIEIAKVAVEQRKFYDNNFTDFSVEKIHEDYVKISVTRNDVRAIGFFGFQLQKNNGEYFSWVYKGDDTTFHENDRIRIRHLSRKLCIDVSSQ